MWFIYAQGYSAKLNKIPCSVFINKYIALCTKLTTVVGTFAKSLTPAAVRGTDNENGEVRFLPSSPLHW